METLSAILERKKQLFHVYKITVEKKKVGRMKKLLRRFF